MARGSGHSLDETFLGMKNMSILRSTTKDESIPRPEYPRPQMVRERWLNLNGKWEFQLDPDISGEGRGLHRGAHFDQTITVPFCPESELSGINHKDFMPCVWYRREFILPEDWFGQRVLLHFGAVDYEATVWLNEQCLGQHRGGYAPFTFEITDLVSQESNVLVVRAVDDTRSPLQPSGKQSPQRESFRCYYTRTTGIWQTVWLEMVPRTYIQSFRIQPDLDQGKVMLNIKIDGKTDGLRLMARVYASGNKVGEADLVAQSTMSFSVNLSETHPWEPGSPFLYDLELTLEKTQKPLDRIKSYFGLRHIQLQGKKFLINGKSIFQRLVLDQGYYPDGIYTAPNDEALRQDIERALALGFNGARLHQKVFEPRFLFWADKLGYLVWGEYPSWGLDLEVSYAEASEHPNTFRSFSEGGQDPQALERMFPEWSEILERDFNHPSIIGWCPFNETPTTQQPDLLRSIYRVTKSIDPTRPVIDTSGYVHVETDIYDCHSYEQDPQKFAVLFEVFKTTERIYQNFPHDEVPYQGQPYFVSEYGGIWWCPTLKLRSTLTPSVALAKEGWNPDQQNDKAWGYGERPKTPEEFLQRYRALTETLLFHPKMFGFCYTQLYDVEQEVNGLYTYYRQPKFDPGMMAQIKQINSQPR